MTLNFVVSVEIPAKKEQVYVAWLNSKKHSAMTGEVAIASDKIGENFQAWNDYIFGVNLELVPFTKIVQSWRNVNFDENDEDSRLEVCLEDKGEFTKITLTHTNVPEKEFGVKQGWIDYYFEPMQCYFLKNK